MKKVIIFTLALLVLSGVFSQVASSFGGDMRLILIGYVVDGQGSDNQTPAEGITVELSYKNAEGVAVKERNVTDADGSFYYRLESDTNYEVYTFDEKGNVHGMQTVNTFGKDDPEILYVILEAPPAAEQFYTSTTNFDLNESKNTGSANYKEVSDDAYAVENHSDLSYKIQLGAYLDAGVRSFDCLNGFAGNVEFEQSGTLIRHLYGNFTDYEQVQSFLSSINEQGCSDAFIVPYLNNKRLNLSAHKAFNLYGKAYGSTP